MPSIGPVAASPTCSSRPEAERTCIGCRGKGGRSVLLRIARSDDGAALVLDSRKALPGRGAWLHADVTCLEKATTRRAWGRALRLQAAVDTSALQEQVAREIDLRHASSSDDTTHDRKRD